MSSLLIRPRGVCSREIAVSTSHGVVEYVRISGGCPGLSRAVCKLLVGMPVVEAIERLRGITCGDRNTSCPNEVAKALEEA